MRLIDADELKTAFPCCDNSVPVLVSSVRATINHMPTIDAVEVVRCKDCKYWAGENGERITIPVHENCYFFVADDYCSYGERGDSDDE